MGLFGDAKTLSRGALAAAAAPFQDDIAPLVSRAGRAYRGLSSLRADFQQTIEDRMIAQALHLSGGNKKEAARLLRLTVDQVLVNRVLPADLADPA
mgnify:CR=1 FL=1